VGILSTPCPISPSSIKLTEVEWYERSHNHRVEAGARYPHRSPTANCYIALMEITLKFRKAKSPNYFYRVYMENRSLTEPPYTRFDNKLLFEAILKSNFGERTEEALCQKLTFLESQIVGSDQSSEETVILDLEPEELETLMQLLLLSRTDKSI